MIGSAELQVIQATLRLDEGRDASIRETASKQLDWHKVQSLAQHHGVSPLVYKRLKEVAPDLVPLTTMQEMAAFQKANELRVIQMTADLIRVVRVLEAENIPVLCLKGPVLAQVLYGDPAMRLFGDLDILVKQRDFFRAVNILQNMGAIKTYPERSDDVYRHENLIIGHSHMEVHREVTVREFPMSLEIEGLFARRRDIVLNKQTLHTLSFEDTIIHTGLHGTQHRLVKLRYLTDLAYAMRAVDSERWELLLENAHRQELYHPLLVGIGLCWYLFGLPLPANIQRIIKQDAYSRWTIRFVYTSLKQAGDARSEFFDRLVFKLIIAKNHRFDEIIYLLGNLLSPTTQDYQWINLPRCLRWLYPVLRPLRQVKLGIATIIARNRK